MSDVLILKLHNFKISFKEETSTLFEYSAKNNHLRAIVDLLVSTDEEILVISQYDFLQVFEEYGGVTRTVTMDNITMKKPGEVKHSDIECDEYELLVTMTYEDFESIQDIKTSTRKLVAIEKEINNSLSYNQFEQVFEFEVIKDNEKDTPLKTALYHYKNLYGELQPTQHLKFDTEVQIDTESSI